MDIALLTPELSAGVQDIPRYPRERGHRGRRNKGYAALGDEGRTVC